MISNLQGRSGTGVDTHRRISLYVKREKYLEDIEVVPGNILLLERVGPQKKRERKGAGVLLEIRNTKTRLKSKQRRMH